MWDNEPRVPTLIGTAFDDDDQAPGFHISATVSSLTIEYTTVVFLLGDNPVHNT